MQLNIASIQRLGDSGMTPSKLVEAFQNLFRMVKEFEAGEAALVLNYERPGEVDSPDDLVPVITLSLRPAAVK
jgi:hypothetical protein